MDGYRGVWEEELGVLVGHRSAKVYAKWVYLAYEHGKGQTERGEWG